MLRAKFIRTFLMTCAATTLIPSISFAQQFPSKPIKIMVGYSAGGGMDTLTRLLQPKLQEILGTPVVVENKPGASELLAATPVINSPGDGYTLWMGSASSLVQGPGVRNDLPYTLKNFTPIALIAEGEAILLVKKDSPLNSVKDLVNYAKSNPGKLSYGSGGIGAGSHLAVEYLMSLTGGSMLHIPYKGDIESTRDAMAGNLDFAMAMVSTAAPLVTEGKLRALAVTGNQRVKTLPDLPTVVESGVPELANTGAFTFYGLMGPVGMPPAVVQRINDAINKAAAMPDVIQRLREMNLRPTTGSPAMFANYLDKESARWQQLRGKVKVGST